MVAAKSSRVNRQYKKKYRIRNWREYERGLRSRGDVTIWLSEDAIAAWVPPKNGLRGGQRRYSNLAVRTALTLRVVFSLPLRQTEGFLDSLLRLMGLNLKAPDHTTLSRRNQIVAVPPLTRSHDGPIDLIVDSTGLKILGCGEWNAHKHKASKKRRDWRKESGYRQQARVENSFFRYKSVFGGGLKARHSKAQRREAAIGCHILNRMAELGRPSSYALGR